MPRCWFSILGVLSLLGPGCCRVNHLADRVTGQPLMTVAVQVEEPPNVVFTRHRNIRSQGVPQGARSYSEHQFSAVVEAFDRQAVAHGLSTGIAKARPAAMWWAVSGEEQTPALELQVQVEQTCFCAEDPTMPADVRWNLRVSLVDLTSSALVWRDCLDWRVPIEGISMDQLDRADPEQRAMALNGVLTRLAGRLAEHLAGQR